MRGEGDLDVLFSGEERDKGGVSLVGLPQNLETDYLALGNYFLFFLKTLTLLNKDTTEYVDIYTRIYRGGGISNFPIVLYHTNN